MVLLPIVRLAWSSLYNRRLTALLTVAVVALSVALLLGVSRVSQGAREGFQNTIAGVDLIVGARGNPVQLLLYSVFRLGSPTGNIAWSSYQDLAAQPDVAWTVPISLGDSHRGYRVLGTTNAYLAHYRYGRKQALTLAQGVWFADVFETVLGAEVAAALGYRVGDAIVLAHGVGATGFQKHADKPFRVAGILARTGTPVDRTVHVSLAGIEAIHIDWQSGAPPRPGQALSAEAVRERDLTPTSVTAVLVGLKSKLGIFTLQRSVNEYRAEPLTAILPGVALQELWALVGVADTALSVTAAFVVLTGLVGMLTAILATLNERRREMAILRSVGARPWQIFALLLSEAALLALVGCVLGVVLLYGLLFVAQPLIEMRFGLFIPLAALTGAEWAVLGLVVAGGVVMGAIPAWRAYRQSLADGLTIRL